MKDIRNRRDVTFALNYSRKKIEKSDVIAIILEIIEDPSQKLSFAVQDSFLYPNIPILNL